MSERMSDKALQEFYEYAGQNMVEPDGMQCRWADYTERIIDELRALRKNTLELEAEISKQHIEIRRLREENDQHRFDICLKLREAIEVALSKVERETALREIDEGENE